MIKVSVHGGEVLEGTVFAVDPVTQSLVLKISDGSFALLNPSQISHIEGSLSDFRSPEISQYGINLHSLEKHEQKALENAERSLTAINSSVSPEIQSLFDSLNFLFPCSWQGNSMVVLGEFVIDPPYLRATSQRPGSDSAGLDRVNKVLEGERRKLKSLSSTPSTSPRPESS